MLPISTQSRLLLQPLSPVQTLKRMEGWLQHPLMEVAQPGRGHGDLLRQLIEAPGTAGHHPGDAHLAALAACRACASAIHRAQRTDQPSGARRGLTSP